jgi:hypothetical protein
LAIYPRKITKNRAL